MSRPIHEILEKQPDDLTYKDFKDLLKKIAAGSAPVKYDDLFIFLIKTCMVLLEKQEKKDSKEELIAKLMDLSSEDRVEVLDTSLDLLRKEVSSD